MKLSLNHEPKDMSDYKNMSKDRLEAMAENGDKKAEWWLGQQHWKW
jgi:hypothetical protein